MSGKIPAFSTARPETGTGDDTTTAAVATIATITIREVQGAVSGLARSTHPPHDREDVGLAPRDNERVNITGVRWLVMDEARRGKTRSSLVVHLNSRKAVTLLRMGRRVYRTTRYDWNRRGGGEKSERGQGSVHLEGDDYRGNGETKAVGQTAPEGGEDVDEYKKRLDVRIKREIELIEREIEEEGESLEECRKTDEYKRCVEGRMRVVIRYIGCTRAMVEKCGYTLCDWREIV